MAYARHVDVDTYLKRLFIVNHVGCAEPAVTRGTSSILRNHMVSVTTRRNGEDTKIVVELELTREDAVRLRDDITAAIGRAPRKGKARIERDEDAITADIAKAALAGPASI